MTTYRSHAFRERIVLKFAIVGCGLVATTKYFPAFTSLKRRAELVAVCDMQDDVLSQAATRLPKARPYTDLDRMLATEAPDVVVVCTPPRAHTSVALAALEAKSHVLIEKPMALTLKDCDSMLEAANRAQRKIGVMHNQLFNSGFMRGSNLMQNGAIGRFLSMRIFLMTPISSMTTQEHHWAHKLPGGVLGETGPHAVYLSLPFTGNALDTNVYTRKTHPEYPWSLAEEFRIDIVGESGLSSISLTYGSRNTAANVDLVGTEGTLKIDLQARTAVLIRRGSLAPMTVARSVVTESWQSMTGVTTAAFRYLTRWGVDAHQEGLAQFLDHVESGAEYLASGEQGREAVRVMEMIVDQFEDLGPPSAREA